MIEQLLGSVPVDRFLRDHYLRLPFALADGCRGLTTLGDRTALARLLAQPEVDGIAGRGGQRWEAERSPRPDEVDALLAEGYTIGVRRAHRNDPALAELAAAFQQDFAADVDVHLYCTPANAPGFGWHYDAEEVFILQTQGSKEWRLRKNTVNPWPLMETLPADMRYERELMPVMTCRLQAGDWLYIPAGYWHCTQAGEESLSLSVGLRTAVALDVFDALRRELLESMLWRQRLPCLGAASPLPRDELIRELEARFGELGAELQARLTAPGAAERFLEGRGLADR
ncbi:MAG: hypothetical protein KF774_07250 [Planctomyces sp.]|nr:hypothetical protein [Planctomyces sp.]